MKKTGQEAARLLDTYKSDEFGTFYDWLFDFCASDRKTIGKPRGSKGELLSSPF